MERAAKTVAVLRGLGFAGATSAEITLGRPHSHDHPAQSKRSPGIGKSTAAEITYGDKKGFYFFESTRKHAKREFSQKLMDVIEPSNTPRPLRRRVERRAGMGGQHPGAAHALERAEYSFKASTFGCQACGNCVLGEMEYVCPMTCPKSMRNGPCGGTHNGQCEVYPDRACIWVKVYDHAKAANRVDGLKTYIPPRKRGLQGPVPISTIIWTATTAPATQLRWST